MQFEDPKTILEGAAAKPSRGIDPRALVKQGGRLRRARYAALAASLAVTVAGASAAMGMLGDKVGGPGPAGEGSPDCARTWTSVSIFFVPGTSGAEVARLQSELEQDPDVASVERVPAEETAAELRKLSGEWPASAAGAMTPAQLRVEAVDEAAARRLADVRGDAILAAVAAPSGGDYDCIVREFCSRPRSRAVVLFLHDGADVAAIRDLRRQLLARPGIESVEFVSQKQAYEEFSRMYPDQSNLYATIDPDDLPPSFRIEASDDETVESLEAIDSPIVDEVRSGGEMFARLCEDEPSPPPTVAEDGVARTDGERYVPRASLDVDLVRAECRTPRTLSATEGRKLPAAVKSCRFVLYVDNASSLPLEPDLDEQALWTTNGHLLRPSPEVNEGELTRRLFGDPIGPGEHRTGEVAFVLSPGEVPAALEVRLDPDVAPTRFRLDYDCPADLRRDPGGRCLFTASPTVDGGKQASQRVEVTLFHCGVEPVVVSGREWVVPSPPFDATNAPADFFGEGRFEIKSDKYAVYVDRSGEVIRFRAIPGWAPPPCA